MSVSYLELALVLVTTLAALISAWAVVLASKNKKLDSQLSTLTQKHDDVKTMQFREHTIAQQHEALNQKEELQGTINALQTIGQLLVQQNKAQEYVTLNNNEKSARDELLKQHEVEISLLTSEIGNLKKAKERQTRDYSNLLSHQIQRIIGFHTMAVEDTSKELSSDKKANGKAIVRAKEKLMLLAVNLDSVMPKKKDFQFDAQSIREIETENSKLRSSVATLLSRIDKAKLEEAEREELKELASKIVSISGPALTAAVAAT